MRPWLLALAILILTSGCGSSSGGTAGVNPPLGTTAVSPAASPPFFPSPVPTPSR